MYFFSVHANTEISPPNSPSSRGVAAEPGAMLTWRGSLTRNDCKRHGSITIGQHGRPSALAGGVVGAVSFMEVVSSGACTQPYLELAIRQGLTATKVGRC